MAEQELPQKVDEAKSLVPVPAPAPVEEPKAIAEEKLAAMLPQPGEKPVDSKALDVVKKTAEPLANRRSSGGSIDRDVALAEVEKDKNHSFIKAWEDSEKSKAENKAQKKHSAIASWENSSKAAVDAKLKRKEEEYEKKKADYVEQMKNKIASIHKQAEEKRAMVEARRGEELLHAEESAAKFRATGNVPSKFLGCFGG